jgi:mono/diheme cytochrome c family protein
MKIENKVLLGIGSFVGIMLLVGWVAINEPARMEVFTQQWQGRSIERGAELYLNNCASCHGQDSLGLVGVAPALKNPMLFLNENPARVAKTKVDDLNSQLTALQTSQTAYEQASKDLPALLEERKKFEGSKESQEYKDADAKVSAAQGIVSTYDDQTPAKIEAMNAEIATAQTELDGLVAAGWEPDRDVRLKEMGWAGSRRDYIRSTLISGRPASKFYWPQAMPNWAQSSGGPLRNDEINNLVDYLLNYGDDSLKLTPSQLGQGFKLPVVGTISTEPKVGKADVKALDLTGGDAVAGKAAYELNGCAGCHTLPSGAAYAVAATEGTWGRVNTVRLQDAPVAEKGYTAEQYVAASILYPSEYIVPGGTAGLMPATFPDQLTLTDLKNIIAYVQTYE